MVRHFGVSSFACIGCFLSLIVAVIDYCSSFHSTLVMLGLSITLLPFIVRGGSEGVSFFCQSRRSGTDVFISMRENAVISLYGG